MQGYYFVKFFTLIILFYGVNAEHHHSSCLHSFLTSITNTYSGSLKILSCFFGIPNAIKICTVTSTLLSPFIIIPKDSFLIHLRLYLGPNNFEIYYFARRRNAKNRHASLVQGIRVDGRDVRESLSRVHSVEFGTLHCSEITLLLRLTVLFVLYFCFPLLLA